MTFPTRVKGYLALPPVGMVSAVVVLYQLNAIFTSGSKQSEKPWAYSKFSKAFPNAARKTLASGRVTGCIAYGIPLSFALLHLSNALKTKKQDYIERAKNNTLSISEWRTILPNLMIIFHFSKRIFEVLFIHLYSNKSDIRGAAAIGTFYTFLSLNSLYYQSSVDTSFYDNSKLSFITGAVLFGIGQAGNLFHHYLLRVIRLKSNKNDTNDSSNSGDATTTVDSKKARVGKKNYSIPQGGLFSLCWTPHYFFELVGWYGVASMSKHLNYYLMAGCYTSYLTGRAIATKDWYEKEFKEKCPNRYAIVPFVV